MTSKALEEDSSTLLADTPGQLTLPAGWRTVTVADVCKVDVGFAFKSVEFSRSGVRLLRGDNIEPGFLRWTDARHWPVEKLEGFRHLVVAEGDVILAMDRPLISTGLKIARARATDVPCVLVQRMARLRATDRGLLDYLYYNLHTQPFINHLLKGQTGTQLPHVSHKSVLQYEFPLAPPAERTRIVAEIEKQFTRLDAAVSALKRAQATLKRYRAAVLKAACEGRLVPTEAELARAEGREYEPADRLLERLQQGRRALLEDEKLATVRPTGRRPKEYSGSADYSESDKPERNGWPVQPAGWTWTSLGRAFGVYVGATPSRAKPEYWGGQIPWVSSGEVSWCQIHSTRETITDDGLANTSTQMHPAGTVLLGMIGEGKTRGQAALLRIAAANNQNSAAIRVSEAGLPPEFVYYFLEGEYERTRKLGSGNNQPALNKTRVQRIVFPLPPLAEQHRIVAELDRRLSILDGLQFAITTSQTRAERIRQAILKRAFEGRLVSGGTPWMSVHFSDENFSDKK